MKTEDKIRNEIIRLNQERIKIDEKLHLLCQIDLLSSEGNELNHEISYLLGQMAALTWVINK
jgi:hypothetical protein